MKLKINTAKLFIVALITLILLSDFKLLKPTLDKNNAVPSSLRITKTDANLLKKNYREGHNRITSIDVYGHLFDNEKFGFKSNELNEILGRLRVDAGTADKVVFKFARDPFEPRRLYLMAYGMVNNTLLEDETPHGFTIFRSVTHLPLQRRTTKKDADAMCLLYSTNKVFNSVDSNGKQIEMPGFAFSADQIDEIINHNASGITPAIVSFCLGTETIYNTKRWHFIACGEAQQPLNTPNWVFLDIVASTTDRDGATLNDKASVFDTTDPWP